MELKTRTRSYRLLALNHRNHDDVLAWKKDHSHQIPFPPSVLGQAIETLLTCFAGFDFLTIPAPSFHTYATHPLLPLAEKLASELSIPFRIIFPEKSGKTRMGWHGSLQKRVQDIHCESHKFVLILDDILTTGHTGRVSCEAILNNFSFPCFLALSEGK